MAQGLTKRKIRWKQIKNDENQIQTGGGETKSPKQSEGSQPNQENERLMERELNIEGCHPKGLHRKILGASTVEEALWLLLVASRQTKKLRERMRRATTIEDALEESLRQNLRGRI